MSIAEFTLVGYGPFLMFRQIVGRSESAVDANRSLLYHRSVTLLDCLIARAILEFLAVTASVFILLGLATAIGVGHMPINVLYTFEAMILLCWFSFALGMLIAAGAEKSHTFGRLVHPAMYFSMPASGAFFSMLSLPPKWRDVMTWIPLTHIFELFRVGQFPDYSDKYADPMYVIQWCMVMTLLGLFALRITRRNMHLE
jgi:capsular polysaccharide transport system permease protein